MDATIGQGLAAGMVAGRIRATCATPEQVGLALVMADLTEAQILAVWEAIPRAMDLSDPMGKPAPVAPDKEG